MMPITAPARSLGSSARAPVETVRSTPVAVSVRGIEKQFVVRRTVREILRHPFDIRMHRALQDVSCEVFEGEFFGLLGPNGAGKTTLFKILATFVTPDSGTALVSGCDLVTNRNAVRALVTPAVADERSLRWRLTARENLRLYAHLYELPRSQITGRVDELLHAVGLQETRNKMVGQFSTGMKQRLLIARALIARPKVLLLDEPTRGLDPLLARSFRQFLREEIGRRQGCTVLLATHNAEEAFELCDRVAILDRGRLLVVGTADSLREEFGHQRYRVWTRRPDHPCFTELARRGIQRVAKDEPAPDGGWTIVELELQGETTQAAAVLESLVTSGAGIARFERIGTSLADLIERVVHGAQGSDRA